MGRIYRGLDTELLRQVAIKVLPPDLAADPAKRRAMLREARAASALNHPNIITIYETGSAGDIHFIASELVEGCTVRAAFAAAHRSVADVVEVARQMAAGLHAAEAVGVVHADVKPENVMIRPDGWVKVLDFGLARKAEVAPGSSSSSGAAGALTGTIPYMSPEQLQSLALGPRSDIWSFAVVVFEALARRRPFVGKSPAALMISILEDEPPALAEVTTEPVPGELERLLRRCLSKSLNQRPGTWAEVASRLEELARRLPPSDLPHLVRPGGGLGELTTELPRSAGRVASVDAKRAGPALLPSLADELVGRDGDRARILALLAGGARLLTITGAGGVGKTSLAVDVGHRLADDGGQEVAFVSLAAAPDRERALLELARGLGVPDGVESVATAVTAAVAGRPLLVILDNLEQLLPAGASLVGDLLARAPELTVLATSRAPLHLAGEQEYPLEPLAVPAEGSATAVGAAAVELFMRRARAVRPDLVGDAATLVAVGRICRRLDGLPLALELAAARVKLLSPEALARELEGGLDLLAGGPGGAPERQRTLRAAIVWGYDLLGAAEQRLFRSLAVFAGGVPLAAVGAVSGAGDATWGVVATLVDHSLVRRREGASGEPRIALLNTVREVAVELLAVSGEAEAVRTRHLAWCVELARAAADGVEAGDRAALARLDDDHDNLLAALDWSVAAGEVASGLRLAASLWWYWYVKGHYSEGRRALAALLAAAGDGSGPEWAAATLGAGVLAFLQCDYDQAEIRLAAAEAHARSLGADAILAQALQRRGSIARERGRTVDARRHHEEALALWTKLAQPAEVARTLNYLAFAAWLEGDVAVAGDAAGRALAMFRSLTDPEGLVWALLNLAAVALYGGAAERARTLAHEALARSRRVGFREGQAWALDLLARVAVGDGDRTTAADLLLEAAHLHRRLGDRWRLASVLEALAGVRVSAGRLDACGRLLGAAAALREEVGTPVPRVEVAQVEATRTAFHAAAGVAGGAELLAEGALLLHDEPDLAWG